MGEEWGLGEGWGGCWGQAEVDYYDGANAEWRMRRGLWGSGQAGRVCVSQGVDRSHYDEGVGESTDGEGGWCGAYTCRGWLPPQPGQSEEDGGGSIGRLEAWHTPEDVGTVGLEGQWCPAEEKGMAGLGGHQGPAGEEGMVGRWVRRWPAEEKGVAGLGVQGRAAEEVWMVTRGPSRVPWAWGDTSMPRHQHHTEQPPRPPPRRWLAQAVEYAWWRLW